MFPVAGRPFLVECCPAPPEVPVRPCAAHRVPITSTPRSKLSTPRSKLGNSRADGDTQDRREQGRLYMCRRKNLLLPRSVVKGRYLIAYLKGGDILVILSYDIFYI